jgi:hypothetical protein
MAQKDYESVATLYRPSEPQRYVVTTGFGAENRVTATETHALHHSL